MNAVYSVLWFVVYALRLVYCGLLLAAVWFAGLWLTLRLAGYDLSALDEYRGLIMSDRNAIRTTRHEKQMNASSNLKYFQSQHATERMER